MMAAPLEAGSIKSSCCRPCNETSCRSCTPADAFSCKCSIRVPADEKSTLISSSIRRMSRDVPDQICPCLTCYKHVEPVVGNYPL